MKQGSSNRKVNEQAREVIASILLFEISDPRFELVTITGCEVSYDRSVCNVFYHRARALRRCGRRLPEGGGGASARSWRGSSRGAWRPSCASCWTRASTEAERIASALATPTRTAAPGMLSTDSDAGRCRRVRRRARGGAGRGPLPGRGGRGTSRPRRTRRCPGIARRARQARRLRHLRAREPRRRLHRLAARGHARCARSASGPCACWRKTSPSTRAWRSCRAPTASCPRRSSTVRPPRSWRWTCPCATA